MAYKFFFFKCSFVTYPTLFSLLLTTDSLSLLNLFSYIHDFWFCFVSLWLWSWIWACLLQSVGSVVDTKLGTMHFFLSESVDNSVSARAPWAPLTSVADRGHDWSCRGHAISFHGCALLSRCYSTTPLLIFLLSCPWIWWFPSLTEVVQMFCLGLISAATCSQCLVQPWVSALTSHCRELLFWLTVH